MESSGLDFVVAAEPELLMVGCIGTLGTLGPPAPPLRRIPDAAATDSDTSAGAGALILFNISAK